MPVMKKILSIFSGPVLLTYSLPVLMVYLVAGTVAQKYIGLYEATRIFFSAPLLWLGPVPLPGLPVFMVLIFLNLGFKLVFRSPWHVRNAGTVITHIGAALLLFGGLLTALFSSEGYMDLAAGESKGFVADYHVREFVLLDESGAAVQTFDHSDLSAGDVLSVPGLPVKIQVRQTCRNCGITRRSSASGLYQGMARHMELSSAPLRQTDEENMAGLTFDIQGSGRDSDGTWLVLEDVPKGPEISARDSKYKFLLRRQRRELPFTVELLDFQRDMHPGTDMARAYQSRVLIRDGAATWESVIRMNEPLRYKGYTLFQSSFIETEQGDVSVLAVVRNAGRSFPYISGIALCVGILLHVLMQRKRGAG